LKVNSDDDDVTKDSRLFHARASLWMRSNGLQLNPAKTEILWFISSRRQIQIPQAPFCVGTVTIAPSYVVRGIGIYLDSNLSMTTHISKTVSNCFVAMRLIRSVRRSVSKAVLLSLVTALVLSRVDYGNVTLANSVGCSPSSTPLLGLYSVPGSSIT